MVLQLSETEVEDFVKKVDFEKADGLVPVVVQDASNDKVLMQAFMNEEALRLTLKSGKMHYWSRSRGRIWLKGEESGHHSLLQNAIIDCDNDAILFKVQQIGAVCHTGQETCFYKPVIAEEKRAVDAKIVERIFEVIMDRIRNPTEKSYVSKLTAKGEDAVLQKIDEETVELILATKDNRPKEIVHEAADILFHVLVLFAQKGFKLRGIFEELEHRHQVKTKFTK
ncbi:MAG: Phosphoribosyl-AMP cyclohydrolase [Candidatus Bathyarchaeota archaeon BA2]|nr:MAG: Phosphoribosyl-AMP cyclohydrolase [Candidatus Bathyarchaeota archaeon BA2]